MSLKAKIETPKQKLQELYEFAKVMSGIVFGVAVMGAGIYAIRKGLHFPITWQKSALVLAGSASAVKGLELLYQAVMRK